MKKKQTERIARPLARRHRDYYGKEDRDRLYGFCDDLIDDLAFQLVRWSRQETGQELSNDLKAWLHKHATLLRELVYHMPGFVEDMGGVMSSSFLEPTNADSQIFDSELESWVGSLIRTIMYVGDLKHSNELGAFLSGASSLELHVPQNREAFAKELKAKHEIIAELLVPRLSVAQWNVCIAPSVAFASPVGAPSSLGTLRQVVDGAWAAAWQDSVESWKAHEHLFKEGWEKEIARLNAQARLSSGVPTAVTTMLREDMPEALMCWAKQRSAGWAWNAWFHWRAGPAHVESTVEFLGALVTLAEGPHDEIYFGTIDVCACVFAHDEDDEVSKKHIEATIEDVWLPRDPGRFLQRLLGEPSREHLTNLLFWVFYRIDPYCANETGAAVERVRRALHFWAKAERVFWRLKDEAQSVWTIGDAFTAYTTALETILTRDRTTVQDLSTRAASILADTPQERLDAVKQIKDLYDLRSRYVHAGNALVRPNELRSIRSATRQCLLDLIRWVSRTDYQSDPPTHADYLRLCELRSLGHVGAS